MSSFSSEVTVAGGTGATGGDADGNSTTRKPWMTPSIITIVAGSAEAIRRDGRPDGGGPGQSRS